MKFKVGDYVEQINKDYAISKMGWRGKITMFIDNYSARIIFNNKPEMGLLMVQTKDLKLAETELEIAIRKVLK